MKLLKTRNYPWFTDKWGVGVQYREFTKSLIFCGFDVFKDPFRYVHLFPFINFFFKNRNSQPVTEGPQSRCYTPHRTRVLPLWNTISISFTYQKHLKLGQCLEIDDRRPLSKFGDVTLPSSHFTDRSVFYRQAFYRLVCKIVNLKDIDLKFL